MAAGAPVIGSHHDGNQQDAWHAHLAHQVALRRGWGLGGWGASASWRPLAGGATAYLVASHEQHVLLQHCRQLAGPWRGWRQRHSRRSRNGCSSGGVVRAVTNGDGNGCRGLCRRVGRRSTTYLQQVSHGAGKQQRRRRCLMHVAVRPPRHAGHGLMCTAVQKWPPTAGAVRKQKEQADGRPMQTDANRWDSSRQVTSGA